MVKYTIAFVVLIALASAYSFGRYQRNDIGDFNFPQRTDVGIALPTPVSGDDRRVVEYQDDRRTPRKSVVEHANGNTTTTLHRPDGTPESSEELYPEITSEGRRAVRSQAQFKDDGKTYVSDLLFRLDGTKAREGVRLADGSYDIKFFHSDGQTVIKHQVISAEGEALLEEVNRPDGTPASRALLNPGGSFELTRYRESGKRQSVSVKTNSYHEEITFYRQDGDTPEMKVIAEMFQTQSTYYLEDGSVDQVLTFTYEGMEAVIFKNGVPHHKQKWTLTNPQESDPAKLVYRLTEVSIIDRSNRVTSTIELAADGKTPSRVVTPHDPDSFHGLRTITIIRADGTVEKEVVRKGDFGEIVRTTPAAAGTTYPVAPELLEKKSFTMPPQPVPPPVPAGP